MLRQLLEAQHTLTPHMHTALISAQDLAGKGVHLDWWQWGIVGILGIPLALGILLAPVGNQMLKAQKHNADRNDCRVDL